MNISTKKYKIMLPFCVILLYVAHILFAQDFEWDFYNKIDVRTYYNSNVLNLSEKNIQEFLRGQEPEKFNLKSVDDIVSLFDIELGFKHDLIMGHTQISKFKFSYDKYWKNGFKDFKFMSFELIQFFSKYIDLRAKYSYYPYIFISKNESCFDPYYGYHDFTYSKNLIGSTLNLRILDYLELGYNFEYTDQNYNDYFPEYDAYNFINEGWIGFRFIKDSRIKFKYSFVQSIARAERVYEPGSIETRDPSYESDIFYTSLSLPIVNSRWGNAVRFFTNFKWENKYFQSPFSPAVDPFHSGRKDNIFHFEGWIICPLLHVIELNPFFTYESRKTHSPNGSLVSDEKDYITRTWGISLQAKF